MQKLMNYWDRIQALRPICKNPFTALLFRLALKTDQRRGHPFQFQWGAIPFKARTIDFYGSVEDVFLYEEYALIKPLLAEAPPAPLILDLGANIGAFSIYVLSLRPDSIIHSLEASSKTYGLLADNAQSAPGPNWRTHHAALWKEDGVVNFAIDNYSSANRIVNDKTAALMPTEKVPTISPQTLLSRVGTERICILKIDLEGAEEAVLDCAQDLLSQTDNLLIEIHSDYVDEDRVMAMIKSQFPYVHLLPPNPAKFDPSDQTAEPPYPAVFASRHYSSIPTVEAELIPTY